MRKVIPLTIAMVCVITTSDPVMAQNAVAKQWVNAGVQALSDGDDRGAVNAFTQAIMADPANMSARRMLARAELQGGRAQRALQIMQVVIKCECNADNLACLGDADYALGDMKHAFLAYEEATRLDPLCQAANVGLVNVFVAQHQYGQAQSLCRRLLSTTKDARFAALLSDKLTEIEQYGKQVSASQS